jgi:hypothetical protein
MRLVLELQLLAAADLQRQQQQQQGQIHVEDQTDGYKIRLADSHEDACRLLLDSTKLLHMQIRANLHASGSSCLPPEVLQQAGLQLLQALAAPVQQLQLGMFGEELSEVAMMPSVGLSDQLFALRAAATGLEVEGRGPTSDGEKRDGSSASYYGLGVHRVNSCTCWRCQMMRLLRATPSMVRQG